MGRVLAGARARFKINGEKVAFCGSVSGEEVVDYENVDVLDLIETLEHTPVGYRASLNASAFRVVGQSLKSLGIYPLQRNILTSGALEAAIEDTVAQRSAYLYQGVRASSRSFDIGARAQVNENMSFVAIRVMDESEV